MNILGIGFLSEASVAVVRDGRLVAAISEERLNRVKLWYGIPKLAIERALALAGLTLDKIDVVATHGAAPPEPDGEPYSAKEAVILASNLPQDRKDDLVQQLRGRHAHEKKVLAERTPAYLREIESLGRPVMVFGHHECHAATAHYGSGWKESDVLTIDGWGEDGSSSFWRGDGVEMTRRGRSHTFDSVGYFYGSITKALGFIPHRHEGKVLGLAAYCPEPKSYGTIAEMIDYVPGEYRFLGRPDRGLYVPRMENAPLKRFVEGFTREDVAAAAQRRLEEIVTELVRDLGGNDRRLALAGGVFANVKLNQRLAECPNVAEIFVYPNMGDGGLSVGAAMLAHVRKTGTSPTPLDTMLLGPAPSEQEIGSLLATSGLKYRKSSNIDDEIAGLLADGQIVARCSGAMEFGPRALGNRSILYRATEPDVNNWLNKRLRRSEFMPFAPSVLAERADELFEGVAAGKSPARFMAITFDCTAKMRREAPAAVHVDGTARPQLVSPEDYPAFHRILTGYRTRTGLSAVINTSFNMHEEPIVCTADDAVRAFKDGGLPYLVLGDFLVEGEASDLRA